MRRVSGRGPSARSLYAARIPVKPGAPKRRPDAMSWVIVGDLSKIEAKIRALGLGAVEVWDAEGRKLR